MPRGNGLENHMVAVGSYAGPSALAGPAGGGSLWLPYFFAFSQFVPLLFPLLSCHLLLYPLCNTYRLWSSLTLVHVLICHLVVRPVSIVWTCCLISLSLSFLTCGMLMVRPFCPFCFLWESILDSAVQLYTMQLLWLREVDKTPGPRVDLEWSRSIMVTLTIWRTKSSGSQAPTYQRLGSVIWCLWYVGVAFFLCPQKHAALEILESIIWLYRGSHPEDEAVTQKGGKRKGETWGVAPDHVIWAH